MIGQASPQVLIAADKERQLGDSGNGLVFGGTELTRMSLMTRKTVARHQDQITSGVPVCDFIDAAAWTMIIRSFA
jgi:hypothetical protein